MAYRVYLDACVLFSAAYRPDTPLKRIWDIKDTEILTSSYAVEEARRNLIRLRPQSKDDLEELLKKTQIDDSGVIKNVPPELLELPEKDRPVLSAAIGLHADFLITSDKKHFGVLFNRVIEGVRVVSPAMFFETLGEED